MREGKKVCFHSLIDVAITLSSCIIMCFFVFNYKSFSNQEYLNLLTLFLTSIILVPLHLIIYLISKINGLKRNSFYDNYATIKVNLFACLIFSILLQSFKSIPYFLLFPRIFILGFFIFNTILEIVFKNKFEIY